MGYASETALSVRTAVAEEVRAHAARRQWSQTRVAEVLDKSQATISRKFSGRLAFDIDELAALAAAWDLPVSAFLPDRTPASTQADRRQEQVPTPLRRRRGDDEGGPATARSFAWTSGRDLVAA